MVVEGSDLHGIEYELPVASAQVKSCVLLAGLLADSETTVVEPAATRDHTEIMLQSAGAGVRREDGRVTVGPERRLELGEVDVPGDFSSAAFFIAAATLVPGSQVRLRRVGVNPTRTGFLRVLERMGGDVEVEQHDTAGGEPAADLVVRSAQLRGTEVEPGEVPLAIDELPLVALLGAFAEGRRSCAAPRSCGARSPTALRRSSRACAGWALGSRRPPTASWWQASGELHGGTIDAHGDHRIAMLGAVAGMVSRTGVEVRGIRGRRGLVPGIRRRSAWPRAVAMTAGSAERRRSGGSSTGLPPPPRARAGRGSRAARAAGSRLLGRSWAATAGRRRARQRPRPSCRAAAG